MKYDWILFDADETLFRFDNFSGLKTMFSRLGIHFGQEEYLEYQRLNKQLWIDYQDGKIDSATLKHQRFIRWAEQLSVTTEELNLRFLDAMAEISALLPGAKNLLESLYGRVKLGLITNGMVHLQSQRLEKHQVRHFFDHVVISEAVGKAKPDPAIFDYAYQQMGQPDKSKVLMVGDNVQSDILGGSRFGFMTCWLNPAQDAVPENIVVDYQIQHLSELHDMLSVSA
ncbi:Pyrimidine 5'-nucleotidase YjjG [Vibrio aerogenes CECT 7868]|uniref:Pyrimidine 5'-nucleotidase YjjG n=1 Tax=Vibrio aerogenes CECT 7868 TaxID=1216006 RepID=A0A1M5ZU26_9VIBR|nr:pyrimidine 5'-nucleotidase [Vibrio aerogenes]SHI27712.1 Pyrimidine 5'-nucleotidase YjjG [Vibrio aerogenes CECT 7868]